MGSLGSQELNDPLSGHNWSSQLITVTKRTKEVHRVNVYVGVDLLRDLCVEESWKQAGMEMDGVERFWQRSPTSLQHLDRVEGGRILMDLYKFHISIELLHMIWFSSLRGLKTWMVQPWAVAERVFELQYSIMVKKIEEACFKQVGNCSAFVYIIYCIPF